MTNKDIQKLIDKYLDGETTPTEERQLARELQRDDLPEEWKAIRLMLGELAMGEVAYDQIMEERRQKPRILKLWPWLAAACVAALLVVFLGPPRNDTPTQPQIAKVVPQNPQPVHNVLDSDDVKEKPQATVPQKVAKALRKARKKQVAKPENSERTPIKVEMSDIIPYEDPYMQFAEQARALRERGNRVIQRVSMNSLPQNDNLLKDI